MGKNKKIRNLESEIERLRKSVYDRENAIDKLLSDEITDQEKKVIKFDRAFAKSIQKEFDRNLLSGSMVKGPSYDCVNGTFTPTDKQKADVEAYRDNFNFYNKKAPIQEASFINKVSADNDDNYVPKMMYRHTEEGDKVFGELAGKPIAHHKVPQDDYIPTFVKLKCNVEMPNKDFIYGFSTKTGPEIKFGNNCEDVEMMTIQVPIGSFVVPPKEVKNLIKRCDFIKEAERLYYHMNPGTKMDVPSSAFEMAEKWHLEWLESHSDPEQSFFDWCIENKTKDKIPSYVEFKINLGDEFVKEVEYNADGVIKTKITYPDAESAPKTMTDIHGDINLMETIAKMPGCTFQKSELLDGGQNNQGTGFITNPIEQEFRLKNHKDIATFEHYEKYIFLSDYHISSPYINQDIVIKEGTIISLLGGNTYGSENTMVLFPYQNVKIMEEKRLVRRLSPLEICGEPQVCAPAKEEERQTPIVGSFKLKSSCIEGTHAGMIFVFDVNDKKGSYINKVSDNHTIRISEEIMNQLFEDGDAEIY